MVSIFRPIPGYTDLYAGIDGTIIHGGKSRALKQTRRPDGYLIVRIPGQAQARVHRLVAAAFLGPCPDGLQVRHGDGTRDNNYLTNLCYGTAQDNINDSIRHGTNNGSKIHCPQGHEYAGENIYRNPNTGNRLCRICQKEHARKAESKRDKAAQMREQRRLAGVGPENKDKTHCPRGHEYTDENTYRRANGWRACRICTLAANKTARDRRAARIGSGQL